MLKLIAKFGLVGVINTLIDYGLLQFMVYFFHLTTSTELFIANTISSSIALINSYILNKKWTFQNKSTNHARQFTLFFLLNIIGILLNDGIIVLFSFFVPSDVIILHHSVQSVAFTKLVAVAIVMVFNFFVYRHIVFKE